MLVVPRGKARIARPVMGQGDRRRPVAGIAGRRNQTRPERARPGVTHNHTMSRTLYSPRLSDDVVRSLYREGRRRKMPMTRLADELLRQSLGPYAADIPALRLYCAETPDPPEPHADAA